MRRLLTLFVSLVFVFEARGSKPEIERATTFNDVPIEIDSRHYTATADVNVYSNGVWDCSAVIVFPADRYLDSSGGVVNGVTTFTAHGHTYRIAGPRIGITDHSATWPKLLPGQLPVKAYANWKALQTEVTKRLKKAHASLP